ncbi:Uncharacterised protein [Mycoplasmopsis maculosa]|uniref:Uncharacterized protein n=1 Tax=Mycoplasmopsis maculosa TaxID=114885 RepID=A0A449B3Q6_9BACT|nr:Uncharacterised protein [Mycoplasmopsis maculosa]
MDTKEIKKKNKNLIDAKKNKNDEFYTRYEDVANELKWYKEQLKDKPLLFPCDYNFYTEFTKEEQNIIFNGGVAESKNDLGSFSRFIINMQDENSKNNWNNKLYFSHYNPKTNEGTPFQKSIREFAKKHPDGVVISNPPFSLFREFIDIIMECNLKFLIIGSMNAITYKETFKYIKENKMWLGYTNPKTFTTPENKKMDVLTRWFTNLNIEKRHIKIPLSYSYKDNPTKYPKYDNYDGINVYLMLHMKKVLSKTCIDLLEDLYQKEKVLINTVKRKLITWWKILMNIVMKLDFKILFS